MSDEFKKLIENESSRKIAVGVERIRANNFWFHTSLLGKLLNYLTYLIIICIILVSIKFGIISGVLIFLGLLVYVYVLNKISCTYVRLAILKDEKLFNALYETCSITIKDNKTKAIIKYPFPWQLHFEN